MLKSPFLQHRDVVLGHYSTAAWLRMVVMAMWNGNDYRIGLSQLGGVDARHFVIFQELVVHYREYGESDLEFTRLANDILARFSEEASAVERESRFDSWCGNVKAALRAPPIMMLNTNVEQTIDDFYDWLIEQFDSGIHPIQAAQTMVELKGLK